MRPSRNAENAYISVGFLTRSRFWFIKTRREFMPGINFPSTRLFRLLIPFPPSFSLLFSYSLSIRSLPSHLEIGGRSREIVHLFLHLSLCITNAILSFLLLFVSVAEKLGFQSPYGPTMDNGMVSVFLIEDDQTRGWKLNESPFFPSSFPSRNWPSRILR